MVLESKIWILGVSTIFSPPHLVVSNYSVNSLQAGTLPFYLSANRGSDRADAQ